MTAVPCRIFVNTGFGEKIQSPIAEAAQLVSHGPRTGPACNDTHEPLGALVRNAKALWDESLFAIAGWDWRKPDGSLEQRRDTNLLENPGKEHFGNQCASIIAEWRQNGGKDENCWIEIGNELDGSYWKNDLDGFYELAMFCYERVRSISPVVPFITGSTMNFNDAKLWKRAGYEVLDELCRKKWPGDTLQGLHPYRTDCRQNEWPSWDNSAQALDELTRVLRGRQVAITEMGWHSKTGFPDQEIAAFIGDEIAMWDEYGAACYVHFQSQDEPFPDNAGEGGFGAFTNIKDGLKPKSAAPVLREAKEMREL